MQWLDRFFEGRTRSLAQRTSRRSLLAGLGQVVTGAANPTTAHGAPRSAPPCWFGLGPRSCAAAAMNCTAQGARGGIRGVEAVEEMMSKNERYAPAMEFTHQG